MKSYAVSFYGKIEEGGKLVDKYLGTNTVDMRKAEPLCLPAKAFRTASPLQQMADRTKIKLLRSW